jgi:hypothetical protein
MTGGVHAGDGQIVITPYVFQFELDQVIDGMQVTCSQVVNEPTYTQCNDLLAGGDAFPNGVLCGPIWSTQASPTTDHAGFCASLTGHSSFEVYYTCSTSIQRATWFAGVWGTTVDNGYTQHVRCYH